MEVCLCVSPWLQVPTVPKGVSSFPGQGGRGWGRVDVSYFPPGPGLPEGLIHHLIIIVITVVAVTITNLLGPRLFQHYLV